jgi:hypothetical protein
MKKDVAAGLSRHSGLKTIEIWRGKPAAIVPNVFFISLLELGWTFHSEAVGCMVADGRKIKMEIPTGIPSTTS